MNALGLATLKACKSWDSFAQACAARIPNDNPAGHLYPLAKKVESGELDLLKIEVAGKEVGIVVFQIEKAAAKELNIIAAYGTAKEYDLTRELLPIMESFAARQGCASIRFHTCRGGLVQKTSEQGYRVSEVIMRKSLAS